jgi:hypothetical protein
MPTYIYPNSIDFSSYAMNQYDRINNITRDNQSSQQCTLTDPQCQTLDIPLSNESISTCLSDPYTASSCCSLHTEEFFLNSSHDGTNDWREFLVDLTDGSVSLHSEYHYN